MYDKFNRKINYLRISVTDRCNLRCVYCMPEEGVSLIPHKEILAFEEIYAFTDYVVKRVVDKVRITGGEPLIRKGIVQLIGMLAKIEGITDLAMTTNAILLEKYAEQLAQAGLHRVNISLDTMDAKKYNEITRGGDIYKVFSGIEAAKKAGLIPIKINTVVKKSAKEKDAQEVAAFCKKQGLAIRYIHEMNLDEGIFDVVEGGSGGDCLHCNRLRINAKGDILPCLFSDIGYNIRALGIEKAVELALENKPKSGSICHKNKFFNIGG
jgi:cyclic pyranopterin phosphate synthase